MANRIITDESDVGGLNRRQLLQTTATAAAVVFLPHLNAIGEAVVTGTRETDKAVYTAREIADVFEIIAPLSSGVPNDELGFIYGDPQTSVRGIACVWQVDSHSIVNAAEQSLNMIICHETLWLPAQNSPWYDGPSQDEILPNKIRRELLDKYKMVVYRSHSNWDALPEDGQPDQAVKALGISGLKVIAKQKFFKVHQLPEQMTVSELKDRVEKGLGYHSCRIFGDDKKQVTRFAFLIGGFGENQYHMPQAAMELGAEAIIIGEMSEFIVIAALEMGLSVIESLHSVSEIPAIRRQAQIISEKFPALPAKYVPSGALPFCTNRY